MTTSQKFPTIGVEQLREFAQHLLHRGGFSQPCANETADLLVWANQRGVHSHGVMRIPRYLEMLRQGSVKGHPQMRVVQQSGAVCVLDADQAPGATAMNKAVQLAANLAHDHGLGWCAVRQMSHAGAIGYFVEHVSKLGKVGVAMTASKPLMGYHGAKGEALSTNPIAIGVPMPKGQNPIILDMSTAAVPLGRIMAAREANQPIPTGWGVDADGAETTDPHQVVALLPMAGAKGSGLSLMIEVLCSLLAGNPNIAPSLTGGKPNGFNGTVLAINPEAFGDVHVFASNVKHLADAIHGLQPAPGVAEVFLPGERGYKTAAVNQQQGISVPSSTVTRLLALAQQLAVAIPASWS